MSKAMIGGMPVEWWEGVMDAYAADYRAFGWGDMAGMTVLNEYSCRCMDGDMPNDFRGIRPDGTRIESQQLVREGHYGPWPGKWGKPE